MLLNQRRFQRREGGFTLVELLITMLIVTIGLLGLAKLQATAVSNTSVARTRALMTFQAESLAGMIRANKSFWVTSGTTVNYPWFKVDSAGAKTNYGMVAIASCTNLGTGTCSAANLAYDDMMQTTTGWGDRFAAAFPGATASIVCVPASGTGTCGASPAQPHGYDITLTWNQKMIAMNKSTVNSTTTTPVSMVMHIQP